MSSAKQVDVSKLDNPGYGEGSAETSPAWPKANHRARTELCV